MNGLKFKQRQASTITEDQLVGTFNELREGATVKIGKSKTGYWATITNEDGSSVIINTSRRVTAAIDNSLDGVEGDSVRRGIVMQLLDQSMVTEVPDLIQNADGSQGKQKRDPISQEPLTRYLFTTQGTAGFTEEQVNSDIATAGKFSLKSAMVHRI